MEAARDSRAARRAQAEDRPVQGRHRMQRRPRTAPSGDHQGRRGKGPRALLIACREVQDEPVAGTSADERPEPEDVRRDAAGAAAAGVGGGQEEGRGEGRSEVGRGSGGGIEGALAEDGRTPGEAEEGSRTRGGGGKEEDHVGGYP